MRCRLCDLLSRRLWGVKAAASAVTMMGFLKSESDIRWRHDERKAKSYHVVGYDRLLEIYWAPCNKAYGLPNIFDASSTWWMSLVTAKKTQINIGGVETFSKTNESSSISFRLFRRKCADFEMMLILGSISHFPFFFFYFREGSACGFCHSDSCRLYRRRVFAWLASFVIDSRTIEESPILFLLLLPPFSLSRTATRLYCIYSRIRI